MSRILDATVDWIKRTCSPINIAHALLRAVLLVALIALALTFAQAIGWTP